MDEWEDEPLEYTSEEAAYDAWIEQLEDSAPTDLLQMMQRNLNIMAGAKQEYEVKIDKLEQQNNIIMTVLKEKIQDKTEEEEKDTFPIPFSVITRADIAEACCVYLETVNAVLTDDTIERIANRLHNAQQDTYYEDIKTILEDLGLLENLHKYEENNPK